MDQPTVNCPKCGYAVEIGSPICGNCGHQIGDYRPIAQAPLASGRSGATRLLIVLFIFVVLGGIVWRVTGAIGDFVRNSSFDEISGAFDEFSGAIDPEPVPVETVESPYKGVRALATALNEGGLHCKQIKVDHSDEYVTTGSCQVPGKRIPLTHVQINMFFQKTSLDAVEDQMQQHAFNVVHDANWFVITLKPTARKVHKILGGSISFAR